MCLGCEAVIRPRPATTQLTPFMTTAITENRPEARADGLARVEDRRLLIGQGLFVHDIQLAGMCAAFVRSTI